MSDSLNPISIGVGPSGDLGHSVDPIKASTLITYIKEVVSPALEGRSYVHPSFNKLLKHSNSQDKLKQFITDTQVKSILIQRISEEKGVAFVITDESNYSNSKVTGHLLIKKLPVLVADKNIANQLLYMRIDETNILGRFLPFVLNFHKEGDKMFTLTEKRIAELEMNLLRLLQNIDLPEINLQVHPTVLTVVQKCAGEGRKATLNDFADRIENSIFLNQLEYRVNRWIKEIQKVTKLDRNVSTVLEEISFWLNLERALLRIQEKVETVEVALTLDILKKGKRLRVTVNFDAEIHLQEALEKVKDYNRLMEDFPINDLLSATDLDNITFAILLIFGHMRKIRNTKYPIKRAFQLIEAISNDFMSQLFKVLRSQLIMNIHILEFEKLVNTCYEVLRTWDDELSEFKFSIEDMCKRDEIEALVCKIDLAHCALRNRLEKIQWIRNESRILWTLFFNVLRPVFYNTAILATRNLDVDQFVEIEKELPFVYLCLQYHDPLDISEEGCKLWKEAMEIYESNINQVECRFRIIVLVQFGRAKHVDEIFELFSWYRALFARPKIFAIIETYRDLFIAQFKNDIPPDIGMLVWNAFFEKQFSNYMKHVESIFCENWENYVDRRALESRINTFLLSLNTKELFDEWTRKVEQRQKQLADRIFIIQSVESKADDDKNLRLRINCPGELITLPKEVRQLKSLDLSVRLDIINTARKVFYQLAPLGVSIIESVERYERTCAKVEKLSLILLVAEMKNDVQTILIKGVPLVWKSDELGTYAKGLADFVRYFHEKVDKLLVINEQIEIEMKNLENCSYSSTVFAEILNRIQKSIDDLSLHRYSNISQWVHKLNEEIEKRLGSRLHAGIKAWTSALVGQEKDDNKTTEIFKADDDPKIQALCHEFRITNQVLYIGPSIEEARYNLLQQLFSWQNVILSLKRIEPNQSEVCLDHSIEPKYRNLIKKMTDGHLVIEQAYEAIEDKIQQMKTYVDQWLTYQSLSDLQPEILYAQLGDDISKWTQVLAEIKKSRSIFDTTETRKEIGPIIIDYAKVQSKVITKYDSWRNEILFQFQIILRRKYF